MAGVVVPSLTVTSRMAVRLAGVELELVPAPGETEVQRYTVLSNCDINVHRYSQMYCQEMSVFNRCVNEISW